MAKTKVTGGYIADGAITSDHLHTTLDLSTKTLTIGATTVSGHLIPDTNITYDLGSSTYRFRDIYLDGTTINLGGTELKKNSDGDIEFKSGSNFKRLVVSELEFDDGSSRKKFKIDSGRIKSFDSSGASDTADKISLSSNTTDDLGEGSSNLYFTTARARSSFSASTGIAITDGAISAAAVPNSSLTNSSVTINSNSLSLGGTLTLDTDDIGEGSSNLYYTTARWDTKMAAADTDDLSEGSTNLYFTNARARGAISVSGNALSYNSSTGVLTANYEESPSFTGNVTAGGYLQATSYLYTRDNLRVLNTAGDGWNTWGTRSNGNYNLNVGTVQATSFSDGTISGITFIDEDSFATNSATRVPTQQSIKAYVDAQVAGVVDTAPAALDTLNELAAALGDDANFSTTTSTALGNRLRVDTAAQGLTGTQQANAITNLGITATKAELNYVDGVTSNIQTQLDGKQPSGSYLTGNQTITLSGDVSGSGTTSIAVTIADDSHNHVISNVDGLQTALDAKAPLANPTFTANITVTGDGFFNGTKLEGDSKEMIRYSDAWLRLNPANEFTSGIYCGTGVLRTDGTFQVGSSGSIFAVNGSNGNVTLAGTVDGRDIAADGTKLDGIESGATADQTAAEILSALLTVDGSGSGLDADLLDGISSASFLRSDADDTYTGNLTVTGNINQTGALTATSKSFDIEHPTKEGMRLHHGVLEGPEHAVYIRGKSNSYIIELPDYWEGLVHENTITVQLTPIGGQNDMWIENIEDNKVYINCEREMKQYFYFIQAERKDIERFEVEYGNSI